MTLFTTLLVLAIGVAAGYCLRPHLHRLRAYRRRFKPVLLQRLAADDPALRNERRTP